MDYYLDKVDKSTIPRKIKIPCEFDYKYKKIKNNYH